MKGLLRYKGVEGITVPTSRSRTVTCHSSQFADDFTAYRYGVVGAVVCVWNLVMSDRSITPDC